jgi:hypothetical protein
MFSLNFINKKSLCFMCYSNHLQEAKILQDFIIVS